MSLSGTFSLVLLSTCGCGGGGGSSTSTSPSYAGIYTGSFSQNAGSIVFTVDSEGAVEASISSKPSVFLGTGSIKSNGAFSVSAKDINGNSKLLFTGTVTGQKSAAKWSGQLSGSISSKASGAYYSDGSKGPFVGTLAIELSGGDKGIMIVSIDSNGTANGSVSFDTIGRMAVSGKVSAVGTMALKRKGTGAGVSFAGNFSIEPSKKVAGSGTWLSATGSKGVWATTSPVAGWKTGLYQANVTGNFGTKASVMLLVDGTGKYTVHVVSLNGGDFEGKGQLSSSGVFHVEARDAVRNLPLTVDGKLSIVSDGGIVEGSLKGLINESLNGTFVDEAARFRWEGHCTCTWLSKKDGKVLAHASFDVDSTGEIVNCDLDYPFQGGSVSLDGTYGLSFGTGTDGFGDMSGIFFLDSDGNRRFGGYGTSGNINFYVDPEDQPAPIDGEEGNS
ncbi:MAG: hypothetical protein JNM34_07885 [Chthonomonadaceae bacterium]|nr:hypothetical protein [Chthonomonadaceae bacterium]